MTIDTGRARFDTASDIRSRDQAAPGGVILENSSQLSTPGMATTKEAAAAAAVAVVAATAARRIVQPDPSRNRIIARPPIKLPPSDRARFSGISQLAAASSIPVEPLGV